MTSWSHERYNPLTAADRIRAEAADQAGIQAPALRQEAQAAAHAHRARRYAWICTGLAVAMAVWAVIQIFVLE